jgi:hypothetical protein
MEILTELSANIWWCIALLKSISTASKILPWSKKLEEVAKERLIYRLGCADFRAIGL